MSDAQPERSPTWSARIQGAPQTVWPERGSQSVHRSAPLFYTAFLQQTRAQTPCSSDDGWDGPSGGSRDCSRVCALKAAPRAPASLGRLHPQPRNRGVGGPEQQGKTTPRSPAGPARPRSALHTRGLEPGWPPRLAQVAGTSGQRKGRGGPGVRLAPWAGQNEAASKPGFQVPLNARQGLRGELTEHLLSSPRSYRTHRWIL